MATFTRRDYEYQARLLKMWQPDGTEVVPTDPAPGFINIYDATLPDLETEYLEVQTGQRSSTDVIGRFQPMVLSLDLAEFYPQMCYMNWTYQIEIKRTMRSNTAADASTRTYLLRGKLRMITGGQLGEVGQDNPMTLTYRIRANTCTLEPSTVVWVVNEDTDTYMFGGQDALEHV